jgi:hypothetical protein
MTNTTQNHDAPDPNGRQRGGNGRFLRSIETAERDAKACRLRSDGWTYPAIAAELGYCGPGEAYNATQRAMMAIIREPAEELLRLELDRLDMMWRAAVEVLRRKHVTVSHGKVVIVDGQPLPDDAPVLNAIDRLLSIQARRAKLLGLDAPKKIEVLSMDVIDAEILRLSAELGVTVSECKDPMIGS